MFVRLQATNLILRVLALIAVTSLLGLPVTFAQSPEVSAEWALFNQILIIGIATGIVVFGIMFYAIIRYREKPQKAGPN